jgi:hypothetical protein
MALTRRIVHSRRLLEEEEDGALQAVPWTSHEQVGVKGVAVRIEVVRGVAVP